MARKVYKIYDIMLKLLVLIYGDYFLKFLNLDENIKQILNIEFTNIKGESFYLDFLCLLKNNELRHIEFQKKKPDSDDYTRFRKYAIAAEAYYGQNTRTLIVRYCKTKNEKKTIGFKKGLILILDYFYLGGVDFEDVIEKINIKVATYKKSNVITKISPLEEISLLVMCLVDEVQDIKVNLKKIYDITQFGDLFDKERFHLFKFLLNLELENLISKGEIMELKQEFNKDLMEDVVMSPQVIDEFKKAMQEIDEKEIQIIEEKARNKGIEEGREQGKIEGIKEGKIAGMKEGIQEGIQEGIEQGKIEGIEQGKMEGMKETIIKLKNFHSAEEIAEMLELNIDYVKSIQ